MSAYYNENDHFAAQWIRNLVKRGLIAPGEVDERNIQDVKAADLKGFTQCHFFAGIGGWSHALRLAGVANDEPVWTGSCPCQPFSAAGRQEGKADARHLWPVWASLIRECRPPRVFGEQVASAIAHGWLDEVAHDLEAEGYAVAAAVLPACSVGAPHRRDRLWFVAQSERAGERRRGLYGPREGAAGAEERASSELGGSRDGGTLADSGSGRRGEPGERQTQQPGRAEAIGAGSGTVADAQGERLEERCESGAAGAQRQTIERGGILGDSQDWGRHDESGADTGSDRNERRPQEPTGGSGSPVEHASIKRRGEGWPESELRRGRPTVASTSVSGDVEHTDIDGRKPGREAAEALGHWGPTDAASWILCGDGKRRPVEPGIRLLATRIPNRVGKLRGFGNAIVPQVAAEFIRAAWL